MAAYPSERSVTVLQLSAEFLGTGSIAFAMLCAAILGEKASGSSIISVAVAGIAALAAMTLSIRATLTISGGHLNPLVTFARAIHGEQAAHIALYYPIAQTAGALSGAALAHFAVNQVMVQVAERAVRGEANVITDWLSGFGFILVLMGLSHARPAASTFLVSLYVSAVFLLSGGVSYPNPAITIARALTESEAGIRALDLGPMILAQFAGAAGGYAVARWVWRSL